MSETQSELRSVRFGAFEADLRTGELRRKGVKLKLSGQPFQILAILLERPGELVTREELQNRVWPDTIVDVERNLNTAINRIREVLGDTTDRPRFVETLPRRGYRFIAVVEALPQLDQHRPEQPQVKADSATLDIVEHAQPHLLAKPGTTPIDRGRMAAWWPVLAGIAVIGIAAAVYWLRPLPPPRITAHKQITQDGRPKELIGTDGNRLYFRQEMGKIAQVSASGGESAEISVPLDHITGLADVSADGSNLLIATRRQGYTLKAQLWVVPVFGGAIRRLPDGWWGAFSPDSTLVAYWTLDGDISVVRSDGTSARKLASIGTVAKHRVSLANTSVSWSPDGKSIRAFTRDGGLWEIAADGSSARELHVQWPSWGYRCCGRWTPDGSFFLFLNGTTRGYFPQPEIWALDERHRLFRNSSSNPIQLTSGPMEWGTPAPAPDARAIYAVAGTTRGELSRLDLKQRELQPFLGGISAQGVSFSRDGMSVAYVSIPDGVLWKADRDGSHPAQLSEPGMDVCLPRWSPDNTQILFYELVDYGIGGHMYVVPADGSASPRRVLPQHEPFERDPGWSPDGQQIVFGAPDPYSNNHPSVQILDLKTQRISTVPGSIDTYSPRWSPNGRYIAALSSNALTLKIFDTQTQHWSAIPARDDFAFPEWSPDSQWIYFTRTVSPPETGVAGLFRINVNGGEPEQLIDLSHFHVGGWWGSWLGLDPTGAPLIVKEVGSRDIYRLAFEVK
jgi:DNA-binding winged helix-turn-helix (wHTH) protein/Tol biopolymer transport system component